MLAYHVTASGLSLIAGGVAFPSLRRDMPNEGELAAYQPAIAAQMRL